MPAVISRHIANSRSRPTDLTVLTEVWMMTGERSATAAASTASMVRSLTTLIAGTPYRSANARSTISFSGTTATQCLLVTQGQRTFGAAPPGSVIIPNFRGDFPYRDTQGGWPGSGRPGLRAG